MAYKLVASQMMVNEANFASDKLNLHDDQRFGLSNAVVSVNPPLRGGFGHVATPFYQYSFPGGGTIKQGTNANGTIYSYPERGKLAYVSKKNPFGKYLNNFEERYEVLPKLTSLIDTNGAYNLATQWLAAISVNISSLEKKHKPQVSQEYFLDSPISVEDLYQSIRTNGPGSISSLSESNRVYLPIYNVTWGGGVDDTPPIWVQIFGVTKEMIHIRMEDTTFLMRQPIVITNAVELNTRPDPPQKQLRPPPVRAVIEPKK